MPDKKIMNQRINDMLEDTGGDDLNALNSYRSARGLRSQLSPPYLKDKTDRTSRAAQRDLERDTYDVAPPGASTSGRGADTGYSKGGMVKKHGSPKVSAPCKDSKTIKCY